MNYFHYFYYKRDSGPVTMGGKHYAQHDDECPMLGGERLVQQAAGALG
jgi:hypothetical protein